MKKNSTKTPEIPEMSFMIINHVIDAWNNEMKLLLNKHSLTQTEFNMLASAYWFHLQNKSVTQVNVCSYAGIKQMNASIILRKLQVRKFLLRKEHPVDTRAKTIHLSTDGIQTTINLLTEVDKINSRFFGIPKGNETSFNKKIQEIRNSNRE
jgi:DNA-binding MarR family transcriptional regulator